MTVWEPQDMNAAFAAAVGSGDIEQVVALYEPHALLAPQPGARARGIEQIRSALADLIALGGAIESRNNYCMQVGELALLQGEWRLATTGPDGSPIELTARTAEIVRRQPDGSWLYVVDHAFGSD